MKRNIFFTPGPSALYFTVEDHIKQALREQIPSVSHRSKAFEAIFARTVENLKALLNVPGDYHVVFMGSATEVWERIIQNCVNYESFHLVNGAFSNRFFEISRLLGKNAQKLESKPGSCPDINHLLVSDTYELIAITQNETSTGAAFPVEEIYKIRKSFPEQLIAVDIVSSVPSVALDFRQVDTAYFSVQKCFGLPAGLGVWIVGPKCLEKAESIANKGETIGSYHSLPSLVSYARKNQTPETPNVLGIYLLGKVVEDMLRTGVGQIRRDTNYKAAVLYNMLHQSTSFSSFVKDDKYKSKTVVVAETKTPSKEISDHLANKRMLVGSGYSKFKYSHIRIANFPAHSKEQIEMLADELAKWQEK